MAVDTENGHPAMDYAEHIRTYQGFLQLTKIGVITTIIVLAGMAFFLV